MPPTLVVSGPVTLAEAPRWREALLMAVGEESPRVDLSASGPWDLAGLQLLIAAVRSGRGVRFTRVPGVVVAIAGRAGVAERLGEAIDDYVE